MPIAPIEIIFDQNVDQNLHNYRKNCILGQKYAPIGIFFHRIKSKIYKVVKKFAHLDRNLRNL